MAISYKLWAGAGTTLLLASVLVSIPRVTASAQMPPATAPDGTPFLMVNINPTETPPMVNVNPHGAVPRVDINQMPELSLRPVGCDDPNNFESGIGTDVTGPIMLTFLDLEEATEASLDRGAGETATVELGDSTLRTAIYLGPGQRLAFTDTVLYSGCRPG